MVYEILYRTVFGHKIERIAAGDEESALDAFWRSRHRELNEVVSIGAVGSAADGERDERAGDRGEQSLEAVGGHLERQVVGASEEDEAVGHRDGVDVPVLVGDGECVLISGDGDEVQCKRLFNHRLLVNGPVAVRVLKPPLEVPGLVGVPADPE